MFSFDVPVYVGRMGLYYFDERGIIQVNVCSKMLTKDYFNEDRFTEGVIRDSRSLRPSPRKTFCQDLYFLFSYLSFRSEVSKTGVKTHTLLLYHYSKKLPNWILRITIIFMYECIFL
jgi:hypothetical protein